MKKVVQKLLHRDLCLPACLRRIIRFIYRVSVLLREGFEAGWGLLVVKPVVLSLVEGGRKLRIERIPYIRGRGRLVLGEGVYLSGLIGIRFLPRDKEPVLRIGDRSFVGHQCSFALSHGITIGDDCLIGAGTRMQDNDGHPLDPAARLRGERVPAENIAPIQLGDNVWIAPHCTILKGVTIGDNAVVGAGSVVTRDVEAGTVVAGVPARVVKGVDGG